MLAIQRGHCGIAAYLIASGCDVTAPSRLWTPLHLAAKDGRTAVVRLLLAVGREDKEDAEADFASCGGEAPPPEANDEDGECRSIGFSSPPAPPNSAATALIGGGASSSDGAFTMLRSDSSRGAMVTAPSGCCCCGQCRSSSCSSCACKCRSRRRPCDLSATVCGWTPLHLAARNGHAAVVALLCERGAVPSPSAHNAASVMEFGALSGSAETVEALMRFGYSPSAASPHGFTPLFYGVRSGSIGVVRALLRGGADPNAPLPCGSIALHMAVRYGRLAIVELLAGGGAPTVAPADLSSSSSLSSTADDIDNNDGHNEDDDALLSSTSRSPLLRPRGPLCNVNATDRTGATPLHVAVEEGNVAIAARLIALGASLETRIILSSAFSPYCFPSASYASSLPSAASASVSASASALLPSSTNAAEVAVGEDTEGGGNAETGIERTTGAAAVAGGGGGRLVASPPFPPPLPFLDAGGAAGMTPLHTAVHKGDLLMVGLLLRAGADDTAVEEKGRVPMAIAVDERSDAMRMALLREGCHPLNSTDEELSLSQA